VITHVSVYLPFIEDDKCRKADYERILLGLVHECVAINHKECRAWETSCVHEPIECSFGFRCNVDDARYNVTGGAYPNTKATWGAVGFSTGMLVLAYAALGDP
jgi:hypothetical protein